MTTPPTTPASYDVLLRNGTLIDGSGSPAFQADLAIQGDRIAAIGHLEGISRACEIDAQGLIVAPGFIDVHTHDDAALIARPEMLPKLTQGVTTVIAGNCGISGAPYSKPGFLRIFCAWCSSPIGVLPRRWINICKGSPRQGRQ